MNFFLLALLGLVALVGPALNLPRRLSVPVVIGELAAGLIFGATGWGIFDATDATFSFMAEVGFALVMFIAGTHVPFHDPQMRVGLRRGLGHAVIVGMLSVPVGVGLAWLFGTNHGLLYAVIVASSSASLVIPALGGAKITGAQPTAMIMQIAIADAAAIITLPIVLAPDRVRHALIGSGLVIVLACVYGLIARNRHLRRLRQVSKKRNLALEMRIVLVALFILAGVASYFGVSVMLAGFALGLAVSVNGEPKRLKRQMFALTEGFFAPLFFVWLGASINLRALADAPTGILLGLVLAVAGVFIHLLPTVMGQPWRMAIATAGQLGIPVGAVAIGSTHGLLADWEAPAFLLGAILSILAVALVTPTIATQLASSPGTMEGKGEGQGAV